MGRLNIAAPLVCRLVVPQHASVPLCTDGKHAVSSGPLLWPLSVVPLSTPRPAEACFLSPPLTHLAVCHFCHSCHSCHSRFCTLSALRLLLQPRVYCRTWPGLCHSDICSPILTATSPFVLVVRQGCVVPTWHLTSNLRGCYRPSWLASSS